MTGLPTLRFRIGPIPVHIELFFFLTVLLLGIPEERFGARYLLLWGVIAIVSVLLQELLHAGLLLRLRRAPEVVLHSLGAATSSSGALTARQKIFVHLMPALIILVVIGIPARFWFESIELTSADDLFLWRVAHDIYWVNFWWSIINLLPVWPLDGGQALAGITEWRGGRTNWPLVHWVSIIVASVAGLVALVEGGDDNRYIFVFRAIIAVQNFLRMRGGRGFLHPVYEGDAGSLAFGASVPRPAAREDARPAKPRGRPTERLARGYAALQRGECELARSEAESVREGKATTVQTAMAAEIIAWSYLQERNVPRARSALSEVAERSTLSRCLLAALELTGGDEQRALRNIADALVHEPDGPAKRQVVDYVGRRGLGIDLARQLLDLPNGQGFEAAVRLVAVLADCGRRDQADAVSELLFGL